MRAGSPATKQWGEATTDVRQKRAAVEFEAQELRAELCALESETVHHGSSPYGPGSQDTRSCLSSCRSFPSSYLHSDTEDDCGWVSNSSMVAGGLSLTDDSCEAFMPEGDFVLNLLVKDSFLTLVPTPVSALRRSKSLPAAAHGAWT